MSLVGSLEDLGLGDILQIVSLSRKSGLLLLRSSEGDGRIVFRDGLVRAAHVKGEPEDLRGLLVPGGFADAAQLDVAIETAKQNGLPVDRVISEHTGLSMERLDSLRREHVERSVLRMFTWCVGEFSFEVRDTIEERDVALALPTGINPQYLTMEATRLGDEDREEGEARGAADEGRAGAEVAEEELVLSGEGPASAATVTLPGGIPEGETPADPREALALATVLEEAPEHEESAEPEEETVFEMPRVEAAPAGPAAADQRSSGAPEAPAATDAQSESVPLVVIDPELRVLEWLKSVLGGLFKRIHIFQYSEAGVGRIRQYLSRGEVPTVLVSSRARADSLTGARNVAALLRRLRAQASRMPVLVMHDGSGGAMPAGVDAADSVVVRPPAAALADRRRQAEVRVAGEQLCSTLEPWARGSNSWLETAARRRPRPVPAAKADPSLERLRDLSARLRDPSTRGDVLTLVLDFAAESFSRVAMFMVRDDVAVGIAQRGLPAAGGPGDEGFRELRVPLEESAWFRSVIESCEPRRAPPSDEGDRRLWALLGGSAPREAYVAPIESGGRVAALLYADNQPDEAPMGDSTILAIVLHEAGLALDRALLERALAESEGSSG